MKDPRLAAALLEEVFEGICCKQMAGIPILNPALRVQATEFQLFQGRVIGVVITPWLMALVMLPMEKEDWNSLELGQKIPHRFPSRTCKFMVNEIDGIGKYQSHSLYSPMNEFVNQEHALAAARSFMATLLVDKQGKEVEAVDEDLLGKILRGEDTPELVFDDLDGTVSKAVVNGDAQGSRTTKLSRRELLRGRFVGDG